MAAFHVFVDGPTDDSPAGASRLAEAIAKHYGLPAADLLARLQKGRFRVKGNADRVTAAQYVRDLERLGARCSVEEANADNSQRATPIPFPAVRPGTPPPIAEEPPARPTPSPLGAARPSTPATKAAARSSTPAPAGARAATPSTPVPSRPSPLAAATPSSAASARPSTPNAFQSGLSAAFSGDAAAADLGALDQASFSLASLDGEDASEPPPPASFAPPGGSVSASIAPAPERAKVPTAKPKDVPLDMFAPPEASEAKLEMNLATDDRDISARKRASTPPPVVDDAKPARSTSQPRGSSQPIPRVGSQPLEVVAKRSGPLADPRTRFVLGVAIALVLGFVPAHFVAAAREKSAFTEIDNKVLAVQQLADTPETYATLDRMRADQLARKETARRNAAVIAFGIWALIAGAFAFVWFRKIPWDR